MPRKKSKPIAKPKSTRLNFSALVASIRQVHEHCAAQATRAVNAGLTLRNWAVGGYIHHYQLHGSDRAAYGDRLVEKLAAKLNTLEVSSCELPRLYSYLNFFRAYPQIRAALPVAFSGFAPVELPPEKILRSLTGKSAAKLPGQTSKKILRSATGELAVTGEMLLERLSYTHLELLAAIADPLKRAFYEIECIRGNWPVRALKRQVATLYFERSGLSTNQEKLAAMVQRGIESAEPKLVIRDPYIFEFLGLKPQETFAESDLEAALLDRLQEFLLELGHGFCLEARQKSIVIGRKRGFVDLVFYHRTLKCHVLIELKVDEFSHENLGQLNTYVNWYRKHMMTDGDNPPIGLLLCTDHDRALVEYAMAGIDNALFVSQYELGLPDPKKLQRFLQSKRREIE